MTPTLHARYEFLDETRSRSETRVRLNHNSLRAEAAALALAQSLAQVSDAALTRVSLLYREEIAPYDVPLSPFPYKTRIGMRSVNDAFHAVLPVSVDGALQIVEFLGANGFCTRTGEDLDGDYRVEDTSPNWRRVEWGGASQRYIVVLDEQLWRDLLITASMALNSASTVNSDMDGALLRRQLYEIMRGVRLDEILERLDQIIALMEARGSNDAAFFQQIDDVEELLNAIIALL